MFVGVPLTQEAKRGIDKVMKQLERKHWPVKWVKRDNWHVTLVFLGEVEEARIEVVVGAVKKACVGVGEMELEFKGLGAFPDLVWPKVVWMGLKGDLKSLASLRKKIKLELEQLGFDDFQAFRPHVTLGRVEAKASWKLKGEIGKEIAKKINWQIPHRVQVERVVVYESNLVGEEVDYLPLYEEKLKM